MASIRRSPKSKFWIACYTDVTGKLGSLCVWPDAISTLISSVDYLYIPRQQFAPKKWFRKRENDFCLLKRDEFTSFLAEYATPEYCLEAFKLPAPETPPKIQKFVMNLKPFKGELTRLPSDQVLNEELVYS